MNIAANQNNQQTDRANEMNALIVSCIQDLKGKDILKLDLKALEEASTDHYIICHGESLTHVRSITEHIISQLKQQIGLVPSHTEGMGNATWVLIDYFDTVIHVFFKEAREFYQLENLWSDANVTSFED